MLSQKSQQRVSPHHYSQQTKPCLSACLYQLDDPRLKAKNSMKENQQEKEAHAGMVKSLLFYDYDVNDISSLRTSN